MNTPKPCFRWSNSEILHHSVTTNITIVAQIILPIFNHIAAPAIHIPIPNILPLLVAWLRGTHLMIPQIYRKLSSILPTIQTHLRTKILMMLPPTTLTPTDRRMPSFNAYIFIDALHLPNDTGTQSHSYNVSKKPTSSASSASSSITHFQYDHDHHH